MIRQVPQALEQTGHVEIGEVGEIKAAFVAAETFSKDVFQVFVEGRTPPTTTTCLLLGWSRNATSRVLSGSNISQQPVKWESSLGLSACYSLVPPKTIGIPAKNFSCESIMNRSGLGPRAMIKSGLRS